MDVTIACVCPETPHETDTVTLRDKLDFITATAIGKLTSFVESDDNEGGKAAEVLARLTEGYVLFGITGWTLVDEKGRRIPVSHAAIRSHILSDWSVATVVSDAADDLYQETVLLPLLQRASRSSAPSRTNGSTSAPTVLPSTRRKPSRRSSTTTSRTAATEATSSSLDGVSNSSQSSASAA